MELESHGNSDHNFSVGWNTVIQVRPRYGPSSAFVMNRFFALKGSKPFYSYYPV